MNLTLTVLSTSIDVLVPILLLLVCRTIMAPGWFRTWLGSSLAAITAAELVSGCYGIAFVLLRPLPQDWYFVSAATPLILVELAVVSVPVVLLKVITHRTPGWQDGILVVVIVGWFTLERLLPDSDRDPKLKRVGNGQCAEPQAGGDGKPAPHP